MKVHIKITDTLLKAVRADLARPHAFAFERVGFLTAGATQVEGGILLLCRSYHPVADGDYERSRHVGAQIGSDAMRKGIEVAYPSKASLIHVHTHGGRGKPEFSATDIQSAFQFVPGFFNALPRTPHCLMVLSNDDAQAVVWLAPKSSPQFVDEVIQVGTGIRKFWSKK